MAIKKVVREAVDRVCQVVVGPRITVTPQGNVVAGAQKLTLLANFPMNGGAWICARTIAHTAIG